MELDKIYNMDCLEGMKQIPDGSVDAIICDLPYGTTENEWDIVIPFDKLWEQYLRIMKDNAPVILFSQMPFTIDVVCSQRKLFRYEWIWEKTCPTGVMNAKKMPLKAHENICVFYKQLPTYNPQKWKGEILKGVRRSSVQSKNYGKQGVLEFHPDPEGLRFPLDVIVFPPDVGAKDSTHCKDRHPTQKPVDLLRYLVRTYSNDGDTILDNCMGSGTTAVACIKEKRHFIGFELNKDYYDKACKRINAEKRQLTLF